MLACSEILTLVRHIRADNGDHYICVPISDGSWYRKVTIAISEDGAKPVNTCKVRFPERSIPDGVIPQTGDFIVRGIVSSVAQPPGDFGQLDYMQVTSVGDNRRGKLRHWAVSGV